MTDQAEKIWKNMNSSEKCQWYQRVKTAIGTSVKKGAEVHIDILKNALLHVRIDFTAKEAILRNWSKDLVGLILSSSVKNSEFVVELVKFCGDESTPVDLQNIVKQTPNGLSHRIQKSIVDGPEFFQLNTIFDTADKNFRSQLINTIDELLTEKLPDFTDKFLLDRVLPTLFQPDVNKNTRQGLTELAFKLVPRVPISMLPPKEEEIQIKNVSEKYIQVVGQLRDSGYQDWYNLWILLVRFCHKNIHGSMELANKLLRVVEYAFRNASYQQRLYGYDCWKEFIDNASLDIDHMCSSKQIKLLVTPLKAKFSKMEVVICKRFDIFVYLLEKLQHRAVLCLNEFLEFCFGPLKTSVDLNVSKSGQGKLVSQLWEKCTQVLMALLGHSHDVSENCVSEEIIKLEKPVFTSQNIPTFLDVLIGAISECFVLLKDWCPEAKREVIVNCIWGSLLQLISNCADGKRKVCSRAVMLYLESMTTKINCDHIRNTFLCLIGSTLSNDNKKLIDDVLSEEIVDCMLHLLFTTNLKVTLAEDITAYFLRSVMLKNKPHYVSVIINQLHESPMTENVETVSKIWLVLEPDEFKSVTNVKVVSFLMWPIYHYHLFSEDTKKTITVAWAKIYIHLCSDLEENKFSVLNELEKFFKDNPFRCGNIISFVAIISQFEKTHSPTFVTKFLNLSAYVLTLPTLIREDMLKLSSIILGLFDLSLPFYSTENDSAIIKALCACIKHILTIHKHYDILELLGSCINTMPNNFKKKFLQPLSDELESLATHKDKTISKEALTLLSMNLDKEKNKHSPAPVFQLPVSRASKMANMFKEDGGTLYPAQSPNRVLNSKTPIKVKGSQLGNTPTSKRSRSIMNNLPKRGAGAGASVKKIPDEDDNTADYIPIDTVVKFQPDKLSEHQKEVLKKRKEDIPALYQDLSQSHSQSEDMFKNKGSNSALSPSDLGVNKKGFTNLSESSEDLIKSEDSLLQIGRNKTSPKKNGKKTEVASPNEAAENNPNDNRIEIIEENAADADKTSQGYASDNSVTSTDTETSKSAKRKKLSRIEVELNRIKMDIVGGDQFFQNLPPKRTRTEKIKSETKEKKKRLSLAKNVKTSPVSNGKGKSVGNKMEPKRLSYPEIEVKMTQDEQDVNKDSSMPVQVSGPVNGSQNADPPKKSVNIIENKNDVEDCIKYTEENKENNLEKSIEEQLAFLHGENFESEIANKKRKNVERDSQKFSEDIIESSQESNVTVNSVVSSPKKPRLSKEKSIETPVTNVHPPENDKFMISQAETLTCGIVDTCDLNFISPTPQPNLDVSNSEKLACEMDTVSLSTNGSMESVIAVVAETQSEAAGDLNSDVPILKSPDKAETNCDSKFDVYAFQDDENTENDKEENTPEALETNNYEVMSINGNDLRTPVKDLREHSLPTSPVTGDTPSKTNELLLNTQNISPINSEHNSSDEEKLSQSDPEMVVSTSSKIQSSEDQNCEMSDEKQLRAPIKMPETFRSSRLLQMINIDSPVTTAAIPKRRPLHFIISPRGATGRTRKLMLSALDIREKNRSNEMETDNVETEEDILTFTREVPSPLAVPKSGILKRKLIQVYGEETFSPCAKRKRVNFSDPILTSKKVFIKHDMEYDELHKADEDQPCEVEVIAATVMPATENGTEDDESIKNSNEIVAAEEEIICDNSDESLCGEKDLNSELSSNPGTVESAEIVNPLLLDYVNPIYPNLIDCDEAVLRVLRKVTSPMFITSLLKDLNSRSIKTVGDLAKLSEVEVNRLPFKSPAIQNVYKALDNYYHKKKTKEAKKAAEGGIDENLQLNIISPVNSHSNNVSDIVEKTSVSKLDAGHSHSPNSPKMGGAKRRSIFSNEESPESACTEMSLTTQDIIKWVGQSRNEDVLYLMKHLLGHCITIKAPIAELFKSNPDIFIKSDMKFLVEQVIVTMGLTETVKIISEISSSEKILNTVLNNRSIEEITTGLKSVVDKDYFKRDELLKSCLPILVKSPDDISFYFNSLSTVELGDVIVNRITAQDVDTFIDQIVKRFGSEGVYNAVDKNEVLELCSSSDLVSVIFKGKETKELISFLDEALKKVDNSESRNEILIDLFKFISSELPLRTLLNLHVDFIKKISERIME